MSNDEPGIVPCTDRLVACEACFADTDGARIALPEPVNDDELGTVPCTDMLVGYEACFVDTDGDRIVLTEPVNNDELGTVNCRERLVGNDSGIKDDIKTVPTELLFETNFDTTVDAGTVLVLTSKVSLARLEIYTWLKCIVVGTAAILVDCVCSVLIVNSIGEVIIYDLKLILLVTIDSNPVKKNEAICQLSCQIPLKLSSAPFSNKPLLSRAKHFK